MRIPINPHLIKLRKRRRPGARIRNFEAMGLRMAQQLEPHVDFDIRRRLQYEIGLADPSLPFPGDPLPEERPFLPALAKLAVSPKLALPMNAQAAFALFVLWPKLYASKTPLESSTLAPSSRVANGEAFDPAAILEDREYELREMVGTESDFHFRFDTLGGAGALAPFAKPVEAEVRRRHPDEAHPVLSGGVGEHFNRTPDAQPAPGPSRVLDCLAFFALFSTVAMCQLLGFANGLMGMYCSYAYNTLSLQKARFLSVKPDAETEYPCPASIFSAATIEFGGPHRRLNHRGDPHDFLPGDWCILTSVGRYRHLHGGHIILWDFGLVIQFPPATHILLPPASFATRLSSGQGPGIQRFLENNNRTDLDFAKFATEVVYTAREAPAPAQPPSTPSSLSLARTRWRRDLSISPTPAPTLPTIL
ncbi:hypothetical protein R3P38DRAFT_3190439 [Favolaschia claudopus]|uniref:Uncharacterized protein n=1 Tax=Favolaschia claudopus TaxID=2862362 RepID=A0AAW0BLY4_9AGAR